MKFIEISLRKHIIVVSVEEVDPSQPPCEVKPLKASENEIIAKYSTASDKEDEILKRDSLGEFSGIEAGIDFSGDSADEYTDSIFEIARYI